jgi:cell division protein FtsL
MSTRIGNIGFLPFALGRRGSFRRVLIIGLVVVGLLLYVGEKVKIYRLGYQIEALKKEKQELERANRSLKIEASSLTSPARIEEIAVKRLGMVRPGKENVVVVKRRPPEVESGRAY